MATYERGSTCIMTGVEELTAGRYRGWLKIEIDSSKWLHTCSKSHATPADALKEADMDVEYAYRKFLTDRIGCQ